MYSLSHTLKRSSCCSKTALRQLRSPAFSTSQTTFKANTADQDTAQTQQTKSTDSTGKTANAQKSQSKHHKTQSELDAELQEKLKGAFGDASGIEYEDGQPVAMKRSVKNNMFRYI
ncbi:hypothetical protein C1H76_7952 [Elsinoe australis]|uniref:Uncharacterized protein n=1 Tax=Elsinoe australis TaxID=40998 RepID=A0A4U7AVQ3_9PEZI|nr:hypothetical protein C1H76_7952 [Elsinoe australis]